MEKMTYNEYTKNYIVEALCILLENKNFSDITVKEIVEKAGVGRATFYRNFQDKEAVLIYKLNEIAKNFDKEVNKEHISKETFYYVIAKMLCCLSRNKNFLKNIFKSKVEYLYFDFLNSGMKHVFEEKVKIPNKYVHLGYSGVLFNITREWIINDCKGDVVEIIDALFMVFTAGKEIENIEFKHAIVEEVLRENKNSEK